VSTGRNILHLSAILDMPRSLCGLRDLCDSPGN
jgi:hypothetical protein